MERFIINPENYQANYINNLNECFNGWGGVKEYDWGFNRKVGDNSSDILLIENDEDGVIAGSAVSYRRLSNNTTSFDIGIMTGSWTLPAARRKGCFTKMINISKDLCKDKDVPFLTAFVTETNASSRRLESEGSFMFPTFHLFSPTVPYEEQDLPQSVVLKKNDQVKRAVFQKFQEKQAEMLSFTYSFEEFIPQYIDRIKETTVIKINNDFAVLEDGVNEVKILLLTYENKEAFKKNLQTVTNWCLKKRSKKAFLFSTRKELSADAIELGFENLPGYFTILSSRNEDVDYKELFSSLNINMADKM